MIGISKLYCGTVEPSDALRYGPGADSSTRRTPHAGIAKKPVVVWNCTRACNLACIHCYAHAGGGEAADAMSFAEGCALINDLAQFGVPVLLFSGGEPLCREDLPALAGHAVARGLRVVVSTNGTLINDAMAGQLKSIGLSYVGISLDGLRRTHDRFRGKAGAFDQALAGVRACRRVGLKVGLRYTITRHNVHDLPGIFDLLESENIPRVCFYHMVPSGRASSLSEDALSHAETRNVLDAIMTRTAQMHAKGLRKEVLTVDNHCDGPYVYMRLLLEGRPAAAERALKLLTLNGGNSSGVGIGCVNWDGTVFADQFLRDYPLGNVRRKRFGQIWSDPRNDVLLELRDKARHVTGKCITCRFIAACGGNFRARAVAHTGRFWGVDPACYLTEQEIT